MGKAGKKMLAGAKEALAIARGAKMPAKVTQFGYMVWRPSCGLIGIVHDSKETAEYWRNNQRRSKVVRVRVTTVPNGDRASG